MTERLYYTDAYLREFQARVVERSAAGDLVYLDRTAFYPTSGGQPFDTGQIGDCAVSEVIEEGERIAHRVTAPAPDGVVSCRLDWERRFDHMQQHTGQHLLSAVFAELADLATISFHLGQQSSTIDLAGPFPSRATLLEVERRANQIVFEGRPVTISFEDSSTAAGLRKASERSGALRIISIEGLDRSACGGTHVRRTGEIGPILLRKLEKVRDTLRVEFLCGARAVDRARADFEALARIAQMYSAPLDDTPAVAESQLASARANEKLRRKLEADLTRYQGRELYDATPPDAAGVRRAVRHLPAGTFDELRALAQSFTAQSCAVFVGAIQSPASLLLAVSADSGLDAGQILKSALAACGGRGGGNARLAQGSLPAEGPLEELVHRLAALPLKKAPDGCAEISADPAGNRGA